jgi:hypothetical protein
MRIIGPNSLGILNASPGVRLNATFVDTLSALPECKAGVAVLAQSGALGIAVLDRALDMGLGVSRFVSLGACAIFAWHAGLRAGPPLRVGSGAADHSDAQPSIRLIKRRHLALLRFRDPRK